jgi:hypothetical protein
MSRLLLAVALVLAVFAGSFLGSAYVRPSPAHAASAGAPTRAELSFALSRLRQRVKLLEFQTMESVCGVNLLQSYVTRLRAALVSGAELPIYGDELCL